MAVGGSGIGMAETHAQLNLAMVAVVLVWLKPVQNAILAVVAVLVAWPKLAQSGISIPLWRDHWR